MASQFGAPRGVRGWLAAQVVARLTGEANRWMVDCLDVGAADCVLDVGCGPGLALGYAAARARRVVGVDASATMVRQARRRHLSLVRRGLVDVCRADAAQLPFPDAHFTRAGSLNSLQFWASPAQGLGELHRVVAPGGRVAVVLMARSDEAGIASPPWDIASPPWDIASPPWMEETAAHMRAAGFADLEMTTRTFGGVLHRALLASRPKENGAPLDPTADGVRKGANS